MQFPSGYYGHFRAKTRADLCNYFRQLARPTPPKKFLDQQRVKLFSLALIIFLYFILQFKAEASTHMFSVHDNRFKFEGDPLVRCTQAVKRNTI